jgi:hypothetical protein
MRFISRASRRMESVSWMEREGEEEMECSCTVRVEGLVGGKGVVGEESRLEVWSVAVFVAAVWVWSAVAAAAVWIP